MAPTSASVLIIGAGPAGMSAALALARQQHSCIVFGDGVYRNARADHMHLVPGFDHVPPADYRQTARANILANYAEHVTFRDDVKISSVQRDAATGDVTATDAAGTAYHGKKLILASGVEDIPLPIDGYADCFGKVVFHCLLCKGYEERGGDSAGVLAIGDFAKVPLALHAARQVLSLAKTATIYTNDAGNDLAKEIEAGFGNAGAVMKVDNRKIQRLVRLGGDTEEETTSKGVRVEFADGSSSTVEAFLAHAPATRSRGPFAEQLGLALAPSGNGDIQVEPPFYKTSVPGVFAAGDISGMMKSVPHAILSGGVAGVGAASQLVAEQLGQASIV